MAKGSPTWTPVNFAGLTEAKAGGESTGPRLGREMGEDLEIPSLERSPAAARPSHGPTNLAAVFAGGQTLLSAALPYRQARVHGGSAATWESR